ncbi:MAG: hypothetical protein Q8K63_10955, partial [Acidimicrobiales bacterium]|nr:hypothetical protein [Acidimicrobiales bacterium]
MLTVDQTETSTATAPDALWRRALWLATGGALVSLLVPMAFAGGFEPFLAMLAAPFVVAACTAKWPRVF